MKNSTNNICVLITLAGTFLFGASVWAEEVDVDAAIKAGFEAFNRGDVVAAMMHYENAANAGSADGQARLAWVLDQSEQNDDAVRWYRASAEQGHAAGYFGLGEMYAKGEGVAVDNAKAVENFTLAAENGHAQAMRVLVSAYENGGLGLATDPAKAVHWRNALQEVSGESGE
jgi:TPR repeat protein